MPDGQASGALSLCAPVISSAGGTGLRVVEMEVTPQMAERWLGVEVEQRKIDWGWVASLASQMRSGNFEFTHQGILLGPGGQVVDGQHRLRAVVHSGVAVRMLVVFSDRHTSARDVPVDLGRKRDASFVLNAPKHVVAAANYMFRLLHNRTPGIAETRCWVAAVRPYTDRLDGARSKKRTVASAAFLSGVVLRLVKNPESEQYILTAFSMLARMDAADLQGYSPRVYSIFRQMAALGKMSSNRDATVRIYRAFDPHERMRSKVQVKDSEATLSEMRQILSGLVG